MRPSSYLLAPLLVALTSCSVGPDFERPAAPDDTAYDSSPLPTATAASKDNAVTVQSFAAGKDIPSQWWTLYHSKPLNDLMAKALAANPDLKAAQASLRAASENLAAGESVLFPSVTGDIGTSRQKTSGAGNGGNFPGALYTLHNASVGASYVLDIFGAARRSVEELEAQKDYQDFQVKAAYLSLTSNVVTTAIQEASLRAQIDAAEKIIAAETRQLDLTQQQFKQGSVARSALLTQQNALAQSKATLPPLEKQLALIRHQLSILCGETPSHEPGAKFLLSSLELPGELPVSLPSKLVEQRPDVRAAEANLHAASAAIGVAEANRFPQIALTANIGDEANNLGRMFFPGSGIWSAGFDITQKLFDAGQLEHQQGAAEAQFDVAAAQYRKTVLTAFQDVADALRALQSDAEALDFNRTAEKTASENLKLTQERFNAGAVSAIDLFVAEVTELQARTNRIKAEAQRYADTAALFQALGGGWWNAVPDEAPQAASAPVPDHNNKDSDSEQPATTIQAWRHE